jgi:hypothetical protein
MLNSLASPIPSSHRGAGVVYLKYNRHHWDTTSIQMFLCPVFMCLLRLNKLWNCLRLPYGCLGGTTVLPYQYVLCKKNRSVLREITKEMNKWHLMKSLCPRRSYDTPKEAGGDLSLGVFTYCTAFVCMLTVMAFLSVKISSELFELWLSLEFILCFYLLSCVWLTMCQWEQIVCFPSEEDGGSKTSYTHIDPNASSLLTFWLCGRPLASALE